MMTMDMRELMTRILKYVVEGLMVAVAAFFIPQKVMKLEEIAMIALTAAATFALLDMYAPSVGHSVRQGAGFGIGANLVGFPRM
jgi:ABC-type Co2+ transport system permease subunit